MFHGFFGASRPLVRLSSRSVFAVLTARAWPQVGGGDEYDVIDAVKSGRITKPGAAPRGRSRVGVRREDSAPDVTAADRVEQWVTFAL